MRRNSAVMELPAGEQAERGGRHIAVGSISFWGYAAEPTLR